ncbi:FCD domain-containing protein [Variovorax dokdonensis]|uniref:FCD domain-containing protein n=1 Tax=Variovorax dokdonensis TaxID=344883 RepID=A0ABT7NEX0_9BURK|nr:FCD domain-containing protein [Variovorax dokdonensis]MDM0046498.1 FCD domain-containing protein [Variovorax dokdonensis]
MNSTRSLHRGALRNKVPDAIADALRVQIVSGHFRVNDRLPAEKDLIEQFGASRGSVREALKSLEVQGLIYTMPGPGGGARVREVEMERVLDFMRNFFHFNPIDGAQMYQVRKLLEPETAASVIGLLTESDFEALQASIDTLHLADNPANWLSIRNAEVDFHDILAHACPNPLLSMVAKFVNSVVRANAVASSPSVEGMAGEHAFTRHNCEAHEAIVQALRDQDAQRVRDLMRDHIDTAERYVIAMQQRART